MPTPSESPDPAREIRPRLRDAFRALDEGGVRWCLLRGEEELAGPADDVDLVVSREQIELVVRVLAESGFVRLPAWGHGPHAFFVDYDGRDGEWIKLDVVTELAFGSRYELRSDVAAGCLERRRVRPDGVAVLDDDDAFWSLLLHCLLDKGEPGRHGSRLAELAERAAADGSLAAVVDAAGTEPASSILERAREGDWATLESLAPRLAEGWRRRHRGPVLARMISTRAHRIADLIARGTVRRGVAVAVLGPDGAGKSTVADAVGEGFFFPAASVYMGLYQARDGRPPRPSLVPGMGLVRGMVRLRAKWLTGLRHRLAGRLVIFDRYGYDELIADPRKLSWPQRVRRTLLARATPHPDLVVILDAPGEVMYQRKKEHDPAALERQRQRLLEIRPQLGHSVVVDASRAPVTVARDVTAAVWDVYAARWR